MPTYGPICGRRFVEQQNSYNERDASEDFARERMERRRADEVSDFWNFLRDVLTARSAIGGTHGVECINRAPERQLRYVVAEEGKTI